LLETSQTYNPHIILAHISQSALYDELIHVYMRLGQYEQMFRIIVWRQHDYTRAERICSQYSDNISLTPNTTPPTTPPPPLSSTPPAGSRSSIMFGKGGVPGLGNTNLNVPSLYNPKRQLLFQHLFKIYLSPPPNEYKSTGPSTIPPLALDFINKFSHEMDPMKVLELIPSTMCVQTISSYLSKIIRNNLQRHREGQIIKNLRKSESLQTKCQLIAANTSYTRIVPDKLCPVCHKRIGDKIFALFPNGEVVHFKCFDQQHICPVTRHNFKENPKPLPGFDYPL